MNTYYKIPAITLKAYIEFALNNQNGQIVKSIKVLLKEPPFVRDDVDVPEAVEVAENMAFYNPENTINPLHDDGNRWISETCLQKLYVYAEEGRILGPVLTTLINYSPYTEDL